MFNEDSYFLFHIKITYFDTIIMQRPISQHIMIKVHVAIVIVLN